MTNRKYDDRHGGPYDRGGADSYYGRAFDPHYFVGPTNQSEKIHTESMTAEEIEAYTAGFKDNTEKKDWG